MTTFLLSVAFCSLFLVGCKKAEPQRWDYATFEEPDPEYKRIMKEEGEIVIIDRQYGLTNNCATPEYAMEVLGRDGWEFVWQRDRKFLVKRPSTSAPNFTTFVQYHAK